MVILVEAIHSNSVVNVEARLQLLVRDRHQVGRALGQRTSFGDDNADGLADAGHQSVGKDMVLMSERLLDEVS